jgi:hypothetical protein
MAFSVNSDNFHVFLTSDGCLKAFPQNRPNDFWISLQNEKVLSVSDQWVVGIQNIHFDSDLYNLGRGTGTSIMFLFKNIYHIVDLPSVFVASPHEAVATLNLALSQYCGKNSKYFQSDSPDTDAYLKRTDPYTEVDLAFQNLLGSAASAAFASKLRPVNDEDFEQEVLLYNDFTEGYKRKLEEDHRKLEEGRRSQRNNKSGKEEVKERTKRALSETPFSGDGGVERGKRAVSEDPKKSSSSKVSEEFRSDDLFRFYVDGKTGRICIKVGIVRDIGLSQMLRFMLGFHSRKKVFHQHFEFRKRCRLFLKTLRKNFDVIAAIEKGEMMVHPFRIRKSTVQDRDRLYTVEFGGLGYDFFVHSYKGLLESELKSLIAGYEDEYLQFVDKSYLSTQRKPSTTFEQKPISFFEYSVIDFIFYTVAWSGIDGFRSTSSMILKADSSFRPHIFDRLYVYSNIVKPVDYDDKLLRLMDIVYLQPKSDGNFGVVDYRSVVFQKVDVDVLKDIHILITNSLGVPAPFMHGPMCLTLQFRREGKS